MLKEYKKVSGIFRRPKMHIYFGFWSTPKWVVNIGQWMFANKDNAGTFKYKCANLLYNIFGRRSDPCLPVWRKGNTIRLFKKYCVHGYNKEDGCFIAWNEKFAETLKKWHLSWLQPTYVLPVWLSCYYFNFDMCWKWKYDEVRYEFPPQITFMLFNISLSIYWKHPECTNGGDDMMYWETILNYNYKYIDELRGKSVDILSQIIGLSDYCGYWLSWKEDGTRTYIWNLSPEYLRNRKYAEILAQHQAMKEKEIEEKHKKITCPKCGRTMVCDEDKVLLSSPPQYEYKCPHCGETKYLFEKITNIW